MNYNVNSSEEIYVATLLVVEVVIVVISSLFEFSLRSNSINI
jgi:hypothetical protein